MKLASPLQQITEELESTAAAFSGATGISVRLLKLVKNVLDQWAENKTLDDVGSLTDNELLCRFAVSGAITGAQESREARKLARRAAAKIEFLDGLEKHGGILKTQAVAKLLQVSRQTVNNHVQKGKLLVIQEGNDYCYPAFQFTEAGKLPYLEEVLAALGDKSAESICTFFLNPIAVGDGEQGLPYTLLKQGASESVVRDILREARLYMSGTPS